MRQQCRIAEIQLAKFRPTRDVTLFGRDFKSRMVRDWCVQYMLKGVTLYPGTLVCTKTRAGAVKRTNTCDPQRVKGLDRTFHPLGGSVPMGQNGIASRGYVTLTLVIRSGALRARSAEP